ncbi:MAG: site-specific tyrosine recombinase XerD [Bacteroidetes bacterium]|nr:site-specific tyrosine recombinase XerD [Bacteroidota bacterium]
MWEPYLKGFKAYMQLERSLSENTVEAYLHDVAMLEDFIRSEKNGIGITNIELQHLQAFVAHVNELELSAGTQARVLSGIKSFFHYLLLEEIIKRDPTELLEAPKLKRALPSVLSVEEINQLFEAIDHSTPEGQRNRAMLETMYSCGLRVSELISLAISNLHLEVGFLRIVGKGNKERLVPIGSTAVTQIKLYKDHVRSHLPKIKAGQEDILFLNRRGSGLSRVMVFMILKDLTEKCGFKKNVHPHTLRHSFATHLVEAGADLRAVQEMMGHKSITTTEIYTHLDRAYLRKTLEKYHPRFGR